MVPGTADEGVVVTVNEDGKTFAASASEGLGSTPTGAAGEGEGCRGAGTWPLSCASPPVSHSTG